MKKISSLCSKNEKKEIARIVTLYQRSFLFFSYNTHTHKFCSNRLFFQEKRKKSIKALITDLYSFPTKKMKKISTDAFLFLCFLIQSSVVFCTGCYIQANGKRDQFGLPLIKKDNPLYGMRGKGDYPARNLLPHSF